MNVVYYDYNIPHFNLRIITMNSEIIINDTPQCLILVYINYNSSLELSEITPGVYFFSRLIVPLKNRRKGIATILMREMLLYLSKKKNFVKIELGINPYGDMSYADLKNFYMKYGFVVNEQNELGEMFELTKDNIIL